MSEFVEYPYEQSIREVIGDAYDRARTFIGETLARVEIFPLAIEQEGEVAAEPLFAEQSDQQGQNGQGQQQQPEHRCGASCSKCGHGGSQVLKPGLRR